MGIGMVMCMYGQWCVVDNIRNMYILLKHDSWTVYYCGTRFLCVMCTFPCSFVGEVFVLWDVLFCNAFSPLACCAVCMCAVLCWSASALYCATTIHRVNSRCKAGEQKLI